MVISGYLRRPRLSLLLAALVTTIFFGCQKPEQIRSYSVPKEPKAEVAKAEPEAPAAKPGEPTDRMLAAILPSGGQAWFFKVVGPIATIDKLEKEFNEFFTTIRFADDGKPKWQLPTGWKEAAGNAMRYATIVVPSDAKPLEITVNAASWTNNAESLLPNVNRWRGQLRLAETTEDKLPESTHESKAGDLPITIVDLRGQFAGGMTPPFAGVGATPGAGSAGPPGLPPGHPPLDSASSPPTTQPTQPTPGIASPEPAAVIVPKFTAPADWKAQVMAPGGFRKAAFTIGDADPKTEVTLIDFPALSPAMMTDPLANTNRWRREVGLADLKQDELAKANELIEIDGKPAIFVRAIPDASQSSESKTNLATLGVMIKTGDNLWFVKLKGDRTVVAAQEEAFKTFLKSLRFAADAGATDGNK